ncbi:MAG: ribosomal subunit interface protein [Ignavibacteria bacterium GWB2_36_8]|nr:MAG: ribosomal subunit interface protein [Ignavibacteria bacterium GWB2_36_8]OGV01951.1 MAG: ribosomal subunit interface protein [Ignavibacteria bacterium RIFOXYB2_FULL_36_7]
MNITITARKFKARQTLKDFIHEEVSGLRKYNDDILSADVILSYLNSKESLKSAEIILQVPGQTLSANKDTNEFEKSVSASVEKLSRQLRKLKTKRTSKSK